jgi:NAD(P)-dependent dehydrogenase (short-subunit alcohol dehydrogenase family)
MGRLEGRFALITGAASGIGAATAKRFADEGSSIAALDLAKPSDDAWGPVARAAPVALFRDGVDVRDEDAVAAAVAEVAARFGRIDILVNSAGVAGMGAAADLAVEEWDRVIDTNLKGSFLVAKHVLPTMVRQGTGNIVHIASVEGLEGITGSVAYNASKGGVVLMTKNMAIDYGASGIRVNCLCPGGIDTPMLDLVKAEGLEAVHEQFRRRHLLDRFGRPEEVAAAALFLASDDASFITGSALVVDGGWTAGFRVEPGA